MVLCQTRGREKVTSIMFINKKCIHAIYVASNELHIFLPSDGFKSF